MVRKHFRHQHFPSYSTCFLQGLAAFQKFDHEHTGMMQAEYFRMVMTKCGDCLSNEETDQIIRKADLDGDGVIYYEEFLQKTEVKSFHAELGGEDKKGGRSTKNAKKY